MLIQYKGHTKKHLKSFNGCRRIAYWLSCSADDFFSVTLEEEREDEYKDK